MAEVIIEPTPLVWMGHQNDLPRDDDGGWNRECGWAFFTDIGQWAGAHLSDHYRLSVAPQRLPIVVMVPMSVKDDGTSWCTPFCIDNNATSDNKGWDVTVDLASLKVGEKPLITVKPSIHIVDFWHGWLTDGVLHQ